MLVRPWCCWCNDFAKNLEFASYAKANGQSSISHAGVSSVSFTCGFCSIRSSASPDLGAFRHRAGDKALLAGSIAVRRHRGRGAAGARRHVELCHSAPTAAIRRSRRFRRQGGPGCGTAGGAVLRAVRTPGFETDRSLTDALDKALDDADVRRRLIELGCTF